MAHNRWLAPIDCSQTQEIVVWPQIGTGNKCPQGDQVQSTGKILKQEIPVAYTEHELNGRWKNIIPSNNYPIKPLIWPPYHTTGTTYWLAGWLARFIMVINFCNKSAQSTYQESHITGAISNNPISINCQCNPIKHFVIAVSPNRRPPPSAVT